MDCYQQNKEFSINYVSAISRCYFLLTGFSSSITTLKERHEHHDHESKLKMFHAKVKMTICISD